MGNNQEIFKQWVRLKKRIAPATGQTATTFAYDFVSCESIKKRDGPTLGQLKLSSMMVSKSA